MKYTLGCDPEFFIQDKDGAIVPVCGLLGGTKKEPIPIEGGAYQEDNCAAEINTLPARSQSEWVSRVRDVMARVEEKLGVYDFINTATHEFTKEQIMAGGRQARTFGCDPDYNAWTGEQNKNPRPPTPGFRTVSGHIHVGANTSQVDLVKKLDLVLGVPAILMGDDVSRRALYGQAGAFRPKSYGIEYRVLSNFWCFSTDLMEWVWNGVDRAIHDQELYPDQDQGSIINAINSGDTAAATLLINKYELEVL